MIRHYKLQKFFIFFFGFALVSSFVHPVTPAFLELIECSNSMFGFAFACMAIGQFVTSSLWGKLGDKFGYAKMMALGYFIYALGSLTFSIATSWHLVVFGRFIGGIGIAGISVSAMAYITAFKVTTSERNQLLVIFASIQAIGDPFGYLIGGLIGSKNVYISFYTQAICLIIFSLLIFFFLKEVPEFEKSKEKLKFNDVNPIASLISSRKLITGTLLVFLISVFIAQFSSMGFDQNLNYFLRAKMDFEPSSNGIFKAVVGVNALIINMTLNTWIVRKTNISKTIVLILSFASVFIISMVLSTNLVGLLGFSFAYYAMYAIYFPLQQGIMLKNSNNASRGDTAGLFNAARAFGMMTGPTFAGLVFDINPNYAFVAFGIGMLLSGGFAYINYLKLNKQGIK